MNAAGAESPMESGGANNSDAAKATQTLQVEIRLRAVEGSERPALSNFVSVQPAPGMLVIDFGFLEPRALQAIARAGRSGAKMTEPATGQLASRVAMDLQTAQQLVHQLTQHLRGVAMQPTRSSKEVGSK